MGFIRAAADAPKSPALNPSPAPLSQIFFSGREGEREKREKTQQQSLSHSSEVIENKLLPPPTPIPVLEVQKREELPWEPGTGHDHVACSDLQAARAVEGLAGPPPFSGGTRQEWGAQALMLFQKEEAPSRSGPPLPLPL